MNPNGFDINWTAFEQGFVQRAATSSRSVQAIAAEQMKGIMWEVIKITPPGHDGVIGGTREAQAHGQAKVMSDIMSLYGTAGDAYRLIADQDRARAGQFWKEHKAGNEDVAARVLKDVTGRWFGPFDGGQLHKQNFTRGRMHARRRGGSSHVIFVSNASELVKFIEQQQGHVNYLAAGWEDAFAKLGLQLPQMIAKHSAPGQMAITLSENRIHFVATNAVGYAAATDLQRRIQWAVNAQAGKLQRQWNDYMETLKR